MHPRAYPAARPALPDRLWQLGTDSISNLRARWSTVLGQVHVSDFYDHLADLHGDRILFCPEEPLELPGATGPGLSARQLRQLGHRIANALLGAVALERNERLLVFKQNSPDYLLYMLSTVAAGGVPVLANHRTGWSFAARLARITTARVVLTDAATLLAHASSEPVGDLARAGVRFLVAGGSFDRVQSAWRHDPHLLGDFSAALATAGTHRPPVRRLGDDTPVAMFHTSGTTGVPKCCVWTQRNLLRIWRLVVATQPFGRRWRALFTTPFSHAIYTAIQPAWLLLGVRSHQVARFDPHKVLALIDRERIHYYLGFPYTYMRMAAEDWSPYQLDSVRIWATGADKAHAAHIARFIARGRMRWGRHRGSFFCDTYGSTELGLGGIMRWWAPGSRPRPCVQGRPFPRAFAVRIVDPSWRDLPRGAVGRILVRASTHFHGYWNGHDTWARHRIDGWWWGGDVGRIDERGELLFLDREDDVVHTATGPIYSLPVEELLLSHPRVMEAAVFARPAADGRGDEAIAWIVPRGWLQRSAISLSRERIQALEAELLEFAGRQLDTPGLAAVKTVALDELPLGATGKLLKRRLRELAVRPVHDDREPALAGGMNQ